MYVAVKGGEKAIANAHALLAKKRRGNEDIAEIEAVQIREQLGLAVDRVMAEGSLYDPDLAALAIKQARGDLVEAIYLLRAFRTTLPRFGSVVPLDTATMHINRRISATYKDVPGGQVLGSTFDYTHRLLNTDDEDFSTAPALAPNRGEGSAKLAGESGQGGEERAHTNATGNDSAGEAGKEGAMVTGVFTGQCPKVLSFLEQEGLLPVEDERSLAPADLTREPLEFPAGRDVCLQNLARADEGFLLGLAYSTQRGFGATHPFAGEIRMGQVEVFFTPEELGFPVLVGEITLTECETVNPYNGNQSRQASFTRGYGLAFGENERKAMCMALLDRSLRAEELGETADGPAQNKEFVLYHSDNVEASGFVQHLKLPHYVDFQAELAQLRLLNQSKFGEKPEAVSGSLSLKEDGYDHSQC